MGLFGSAFNSKINALKDKANKGDLDAQYELACELYADARKKNNAKEATEARKWENNALLNYQLDAYYKEVKKEWDDERSNQGCTVTKVVNGVNKLVWSPRKDEHVLYRMSVVAEKGHLEAQLLLANYYFEDALAPHVRYYPAPALVKKTKLISTGQALKWLILALKNKKNSSIDRATLIDKLDQLGFVIYDSPELLKRKLSLVESNKADEVTVAQVCYTYLIGGKNVAADFDKALLIAWNNCPKRIEFFLDSPGTYTEGKAAFYYRQMIYKYGYGIDSAPMLYSKDDLENFVSNLPASLLSCDGTTWTKTNTTKVYSEYQQKDDKKETLRIHQVFYDREPGTDKVMFLTDAGAFTPASGSKSSTKESIRTPSLYTIDLPNKVIAKYPHEFQLKNEDGCLHFVANYHVYVNKPIEYVCTSIGIINSYGEITHCTDIDKIYKDKPYIEEGFEGNPMYVSEIKYDPKTSHLLINGQYDAIADVAWYKFYKLKPVFNWMK